MTNVKIVDYMSIKTFHEIFNTSLIIMCSKIFQNVIYISGKSAANNIKNLYSSHCLHNNVIFRQKYICQDDSSYGVLMRTICGFFISLYEYLKLDKHDVLIFAYTNALSLPIILLINYLLSKKVIFVIHGELEFQLYKFPNPFKLKILYKYCHKLSLQHLLHNNRASILLLGESIKKNLLTIFPRISEQIITINHPYFINSNSINIKNTKTFPIKIGTVGVMTRSKFCNLISLSKLLYNEIFENKIEIYNIGKVSGVDLSLYPMIKWIGSHDLMSRQDYEKHINNLDYILYLYPIDSYKLTASGSIIDAIKLRKPIIALKNDYFISLIKNENIGFICDSINDIVDKIRFILNLPPSYDFQYEFDPVIKKVSIEYNTNLLQRKLQEKKYIS